MRIVAGILKNRKIASPKNSNLRPTSERLREALFNICQNYIEEAHFLDLFAGSGAVGLEALSRGAATSTFVESGRDCVRCIQENLKSLKMDHKGIILAGDIFMMLERLIKYKKQYQIIFADPPYASADQEIIYSDEVIKKVDGSSLLSPGGSLFVEESVDVEPLSAGLSHLTLVDSRRFGKSLLTHYTYH